MTRTERLFRGIKAFAQGFFFGVPICLTVTDNVCTICQVEGISMQPVLNDDPSRRDFVLISRWRAKGFENIRRGDIVSILSPKDPSKVFIKRIIALEGDKLRTLDYKNRIIQVPRGHCWIEGDNRRHSLDSNSFGAVPLGLINGVATRVVWPPSRWGKLINQIPNGRNPFDLCSAELVDCKECISVDISGLGKNDAGTDDVSINGVSRNDVIGENLDDSAGDVAGDEAQLSPVKNCPEKTGCGRALLNNARYASEGTAVINESS